MLNENVARIEKEQPVRISVLGPGAKDWESWIPQAGFQLAGQDDADILLWIDPKKEDFTGIAADPRCIVVGNQNTNAFCQQKTIEYVKDVESGEAIQKQLEEFARKLREQVEHSPFTKSRSLTVPPALTPRPTEKKHSIRLQRDLIKRSLSANTPPEEVREPEPEVESQPLSSRKDVVLALPPLGDNVQRLKQYIHAKSDGEYRVLEAVESYMNLIQAAEKGFYDVILLHRELPGLERNLVENLKLLREKAHGTRIILIERRTDSFSSMYQDHLDPLDIEWQVIPNLPGHLMSILKRNQESQESHVIFKWDEETKPVTALPAVRSSVLSPALIAYHSAGGGVGKSTGSTQMGFAFAEMGYKTLIVELDTEKPSLLRSVGAAEDCPGLAAWNHSDFISENTAIEALRRTSRQVHGLYVLPVGPISPKKVVLPFHLEGLEKGNVDPCKQAETFYSAALKEFQIVIVDTNTSSVDPPVYTALKMAKRIFYVMEATKVFLDSAEAHIDQAYELGINLANYRIILNKCTPGDLVSLRVITQTLEIPVSLQVPLDVEGYRLAAHQGKPYHPKIKKGVSPWKNFCQAVLQDLEVPVNTVQVQKFQQLSLKNWFLGWRKRA